VLPCHRVVKSDGELGNYRGGPGAKQLLLNLEAA
jgi:methylated-DNA-[protein]-cysteine S-methyltransferase